ncbi:hypothetical protein DUNSADRAFT_5674 [Dunaliella salina]|uniref:Encoded protein n=1 Tax=Dunaliella salina TaxID=3046 RepID=A0ABQ7FU96_DUNSA|nr:hypothetical protein DUNSADRAFT_5674 [Dunaliella salina]|eukprot:KAF5825955.1 hypothetical protein DUNSADRAFT_5674 [Dunaliella salina]
MAAPLALQTGGEKAHHLLRDSAMDDTSCCAPARTELYHLDLHNDSARQHCRGCLLEATEGMHVQMSLSVGNICSFSNWPGIRPCVWGGGRAKPPEGVAVSSIVAVMGGAGVRVCVGACTHMCTTACVYAGGSEAEGEGAGEVGHQRVPQVPDVQSKPNAQLQVSVNSAACVQPNPEPTPFIFIG